MKLKSWHSRISWMALGAVFAVAAYQNCGDVKIAQMLAEESQASSSVQFKATACPMAQPLPAESTKFIFVMDMSVSNIGDWRGEGDRGDGTPAYYYFEQEKGTDLPGARFDAVKSFIQTCGNLSGNQFAIIAFANTAGHLVVENGITKLKCDGKFGTPDSAVSDLNALKNVQSSELPWYQQWTNKPLSQSFVNGILGNTNYEQALGCVEDMVVNDIIDPETSKSAQNYQVFFISDGRPKDQAGTFCEDTSNYPTPESREACYADGIQSHLEFTMQAALGNNKKMKMYAIYYSNPNYSDAYVDDVKKYMGTISRLGDTAAPILMGSFFDQIQDGKNPLCSLLGVTSAIEYTPDLVRVVNLSATRVNGVLEPDSDMDGIIDSVEIAEGSDPLNPRSIFPKVLDGICHRLGGLQPCEAALAGKTCLATPLSMGVSECDLVALQIDKLYDHPDLGIDTDKDGMPDLVEIIKGTDPGLADMHMDNDGDFIPNSKEILEGRDPFTADGNLKSETLLASTTQYKGTNGGLCQYGAWELDAANLPGASTMAYAPMSPTDQWGAHAANENVFLVYYRSDPRNSGVAGIDFYKKIFRASYQKVPGSNSYQVNLSQPEILPGDFEKAGEVQP